MRPLPIPLRDHSCIENSAYDDWNYEVLCGKCGALLAGPPRILICGDRHWSAHVPIEQVLIWVTRTNPRSTIIHGGAYGADGLAGNLAHVLGLRVRVFKAEWERYGKRAGPIRNALMIADGEPEIVFAYTDDLSQSHGTRDMVKKALAAKIPTFLVNSESYIKGPLTFDDLEAI